MHARDIRFAKPPAPRHQAVLYQQYLDELVPENAPIRLLVTLLEEVDWTAWERAYEGYGQPPIHPRYVAGAIIYGLINRIHSTRDLERACRKDVDFIWLMEGFAPDHSTLAKFRLRHEENITALHQFLAKALLRSRTKPLLEVFVDGTRLRADSDRHGARTAKTIEAIIRELDRRLEAMKRNDAGPAPQTAYFEDLAPPEDEGDKLAWVDKRIAQLEKEREKCQKALDIAQERDARAQQHNGKKAKPVRVPVTDPESRVAPNKDGGFAPNYTAIAAIEGETGAVIFCDVPDGSDEAGAVLPAVEAAEALTGQKTDRVVTDGNFAAGEVLAQLDARETGAYMPTRSASPPDNPANRPDPTQPVPEEAREDLPMQGGQFARTAFVYDPEADAYHCPMGHAMRPVKHGKNKDGVQCAYYQCGACTTCPLASQCIKGKAPHRTIVRDEHEEHREAANERMASEEGQAIYKKRAPSIEVVFAHIKRAMGLRGFARRGLDKVRCDWTWTCAAYTFKKYLARKTNPGNEAPDGGRGPEKPTPGGPEQALGRRKGYFCGHPPKSSPPAPNNAPRAADIPNPGGSLIDTPEGGNPGVAAMGSSLVGGMH